MAIPGIPDVVVREAVGVDPKLATTDEHVRNEELGADLEQEERAVAVGAEPIAVGLDELDDLVLRDAEQVRFVAETTKDGFEVSVFDHLVNTYVHRRGRLTFDVASVGHEVSVDPAGEDALRFRDGAFPVRRSKGEFLPTRDEAEIASDGFHRRDFPRFGLEPLGQRTADFSLIDGFDEGLKVKLRPVDACCEGSGGGHRLIRVHDVCVLPGFTNNIAGL